MKSIGERIIYLRELNCMKQKELAEKIGVTKATMSKYENNQNIPNADIICKIADSLYTSTDYLVGRTNRINSYGRVMQKYSVDKLFNIINKLNDEKQIRIYERALTLFETQS